MIIIFDKIKMSQGDRMIRLGLGQHKGTFFIRIDLWFVGFRLSAGKPTVETVTPKLKVWYGKMPESNGKENWTVILYADKVWDGMTIDRSEYPDRVRYCADELRYLIGEISTKPYILDYDSDLCSNYAKQDFDKWYIP
jgi:hypothetical protein